MNLKNINPDKNYDYRTEKKITFYGPEGQTVTVTQEEINHDVKEINFKIAQDFIRETFKKDPDFKRPYRDNVAMFLHDRRLVMGHAARNKIADELIDLIFGIKPYDN